VLNPNTVASAYTGGLKKHTLNLQVEVTLVVLTLEKSYSKPVLVNVLKVRKICHLVSYIPDEHKNICDEILVHLYIMWIMINENINSKICFKYSNIVDITHL
jgi:hypothetical protein